MNETGRNAGGVTTIRSEHSVSETMDRLSALVSQGKLRIFARIDHAAGAVEVGLKLRPTELLLFGHPRAGTPLMQDRQIVGLDLPVRALAWEDEGGRVWLSYHPATAIAAWHGLSGASADAARSLDQRLAALCSAAAGHSAP